ncbi:hypothetical protein [Eisenbergiella tayi]|uniref:hypothetical protein n=1 Tax=Eisenbergiella tayi TaxID=1432052 RepID=UPI0002F3C08D|nr:hypothetical protein [Eisenbergiella tayi]
MKPIPASGSGGKVWNDTDFSAAFSVVMNLIDKTADKYSVKMLYLQQVALKK